MGCDLERVSALEVNATLRLPGMVFTEGECAYAASQPHPLRTLTGLFAAKEAFFKALAGRVDFYWTDIEIVQDAQRLPRFRLSGEIGKLIAMKNWNVNVTIAHTSQYASAVVVASGCP